MVAITKPTVGASVGTWGTQLNTALDALVTAVNSLQSTGTGSGAPATVVSTTGIDATGATDVTAALQTLINGSAAGSTILFAPGTYLIGAPLVLLPGRAYVGSGHALSGGSTIKLKNATNLTNAAGRTGMLVANAFNANATVADAGIVVRNLAINGNKANNTTSTASGIVLSNLWSLIEDCYIYDTPSHGVLLTDTTANGTNVLTGTAGENKLYRLKITGSGGDGIHQSAANAASNSDGYLSDCLISGTTGGGIIVDRAAGWTFRRNHLRGIGGDGISMGQCYATICESNYIEDYGAAGTAGFYYAGISCSQLNGRGSTIVNNFVSATEPGATSNYTYIRVTAAASQTDAHAIVTGNMLRGGDPGHNTGITVQHDTGGSLNGVILNNYMSNMAGGYYVADGDTSAFINIGPTFTNGRTETDGSPVGTVTVGSAFTSAASSAAPLQTNDICGQITATAKATPVAGAVATYTMAVGYGQSPRSISVTACNANAANARLYVSAQSQSAFTVSCAVAPTASAVLLFNYQIIA